MPKIVEVEAKRREILAAAGAVFARHGYAGTNLQRVAARAGMGKSSLYHYFPTKDALFSGLADELFRREAEIFASTTSESDSAGERLERLLDSIAGLLGEWQAAGVGPLLLDFLREPPGRKRVRETFRTARRSLARLLRDGQRAGELDRARPDAIAALLLACLDGLFLQEIVESGSTRSVTRPLLRAALRAVAGDGRP